MYVLGKIVVMEMDSAFEILMKGHHGAQPMLTQKRAGCWSGLRY